jgi:pilus assembly protein CpaC
MGKAVNLLRVDVPPVEAQVLLRVRFASVDRNAETDLGINLVSTAFNQTAAVSTQQFGPPSIANSNAGSGQTTPAVTQPLNILLFRPDIDLLTTIKALQSRNALELLAEPNVMAIDGKPASFVAGGEFPFPTLQGGAGVGAVTIQFREFGVRLNFLRRVNTEVELESGQSFVIGGLLDNTTTKNLNKIPGIGDIPLLGKLFQSTTIIKGSSELLVIITPEVVRPIPAGQPVPNLKFPVSFLPPNSGGDMRQPGISQTGPVPTRPPADSIRIEELAPDKGKGPGSQNSAVPPFQLVPVPVPQATPSANPGLTAPPFPQPPGNSSGGAR